MDARKCDGTNDYIEGEISDAVFSNVSAGFQWEPDVWYCVTETYDGKATVRNVVKL